MCHGKMDSPIMSSWVCLVCYWYPICTTSCCEDRDVDWQSLWRCSLLVCFFHPAVETYLARSKDGELGVTGEGTMLENASGVYSTYTCIAFTSQFFPKVRLLTLLTQAASSSFLCFCCTVSPLVWDSPQHQRKVGAREGSSLVRGTFHTALAHLEATWEGSLLNC